MSNSIMARKKPKLPQITMLTAVVEDMLVGPYVRPTRSAGQEVSIRVNVLAGGDDEPLVSWMRVHMNLAPRLRSLAELQGPDGLLGRCCTIGVDDHGLVVSLLL